MADITRSLVDQHIKEYDMRLKHLDDLLARARLKAAQAPSAAEELAKLQLHRDELAGWVNELKLKPLENWREEEIQKAGPMGIWDAVAQQVEKLVERIER